MGLMIEDYIPFGYANRISRSQLQLRTGCTDRKNRELIEDAAERGVVIYSDDGGYFQYLDERDDIHVRAYMIREENRFKTMSHKNRLLREAWFRLHPGMIKVKDQVPGQMSMF